MAEWKKNTEGLDGFTAHPWEWAMGADTLAGRALRFSALFVTFASFITIVPLVAYFIHGDRVIKAERREMGAAVTQTEPPTTGPTTGVSKENKQEDLVAKQTKATAEPAPAKDEKPKIDGSPPKANIYAEKRAKRDQNHAEASELEKEMRNQAKQELENARESVGKAENIKTTTFTKKQENTSSVSNTPSTVAKFFTNLGQGQGKGK
jgi:type IV secretory pathway VirB10-like protein